MYFIFFGEGIMPDTFTLDEKIYRKRDDYPIKNWEGRENTNYKKLINHAKIISKRGSTFGLGGYNHFRFNLATSTELVKESTERLRSVFK